ncbi:MAG: NAD(P)-binding domain-containing protein [Pseudomonadota bacterium]
MNIGILGAGNVAQALGGALAAKGHAVRIGSRNPDSERLAQWRKQSGGTTSSLADAAAFGAALILAINPWTEIESVLKSLGTSLSGKPLLDVSNNIEFGAKPRLAFTDRSMGQTVQAWAPTAHVVKTLNTATAALMADPVGKGAAPAIAAMAGNDAGAKASVAGLLCDIGWTEIVDLGGIEASRLQEAIGLQVTIAITDIMQAGK